MERTSKLKQLIYDRKVVDREDVLKALGTTSWATAYRHLKKIGYLTSFTHTCSYYSLKDIPAFDRYGIWFFGEIGFSKWGNLQHTIKYLILNSESGKTHEEIQRQVRTQAYSALQKLVKSGFVARKKICGVYVYLNPDPKRYQEQIAKREEIGGVERLSRVLIIDILAQTIRCTTGTASHEDVAKALRRRGIKVTNNQVYTVFEKYKLEKKTLD